MYVRRGKDVLAFVYEMRSGVTERGNVATSLDAIEVSIKIWIAHFLLSIAVFRVGSAVPFEGSALC